jgi:MFS family permease
VKIVQVIQDTRDFLKKQTHNYRMLLIRTSGANFLTSLTSSYTSIYTTGLGADPVTLGSLSSVSSAINMLISMPSGWISDRYDLKKVMGIGMVFQVFMIALYAFARDWKWILVAMMVNPFTMLLFRSQNLIFMRSLRHEDTAKGLSLRMAIASSIGLVAPIPAAILVDYLGGLTVQGIRPLFYLRFIGMALVYGYVYLKLDPVPPMRTQAPLGEKTSFVQDFREVFKEGKGLKAWLVVSSLGSLIMGMMMDFTYLYAKEIKDAGAWHLGLMSTVETLSFIVMSMPMSQLADTRGRKIAFILTRPSRLLWMLLLIFSPDPNWLILAWFFRGMGMAGSSYQTWMLELVPPEKRGRWMGITNTFNSLIRIPAPIIGGIIYQSINPELIFIIPFFLSLLVRIPIIYFKVPETLRKASDTLTD